MAKMLTVKVEDWTEFYQLASWFLRDKGQWVFRGHRKAEWELKTTLERESDKRKNKAKVKKQFDSLAEFLQSRPRSNESEQIEVFKALTQWDHYMGEHKLPYLAAMQHYGFPTRLLDFTCSLFVGAYFAFKNLRSRGERAVWAIRLEPLWENAKKVFGFENDVDDYALEKELLSLTDGLLDRSIRASTSVKHGVLPLLIGHDNPRLRAQNGLFLMPFSIDGFVANLERSLPGGLVSETSYARRGGLIAHELRLGDYLNSKNKKDVVVLKIICSKAMRKGAEGVFQQMNITEERMFPDKSFADVKDNVKYRFWYR